MAKLIEADSRGIHRGPIGSAPRLPPRIPSIPSRGVLPTDLGSGTHSNQSYESISQSHKQHRRTPSCSMVIQEQPLWLDDLLEDSEGASKKGSHRRSASDSFTYLENAKGLLGTSGNIAEGDELAEFPVVPEKTRQRNGMNSSGLTDLLEEIQQLQDQRNAPISALTQPAMARLEIAKVDEVRALAGQMAFAPEAKSLEDADTYSHDNNALDGNLDPKKTKRQSAQRSRVRKLQYIAELERIVNTLQTQVSSLSPQLLLFRHQRALLSMDNSALKQKIALCVHTKSIKDSHNETLSNELQRLKALRELQAFHELQKQRQHRIHRHSSLPSDFEAQLRQYSDINNANVQQSSEPNPASSPEVLSRVMKDLTDLSLDTHLERREGQDS